MGATVLDTAMWPFGNPGTGLRACAHGVESKQRFLGHNDPAGVHRCFGIYPYYKRMVALKTKSIADGKYSTTSMKTLGGDGFAPGHFAPFGAACIEGRLSTGKGRLQD